MSRMSECANVINGKCNEIVCRRIDKKKTLF